jgi:predicted MPP superfamily phosphohydrolase
MRRRDFLKLVGLLAGASVGGIAYAKQSSGIEITTKELFVPSLLNPLRIVAISDVHAPSYFRNNDYLGLINMINNQEPDIFLLGGDTIDYGGEEKLVNVFSLIRAKIAKLAVLGNWEYIGSLNLRRLRKEYEKAGTQMLVNEKVSFEGLGIAGLDDFLYGSPDYRLLNDESTKPLLIMSHCPETFDFMPLVHKSPVMIISGHTHGGQIAPFGVVLHTPAGCGPYVKGWYYKRNYSMYVMRGIGTSGIPLRIGSPPEILVLDLHNTYQDAFFSR